MPIHSSRYISFGYSTLYLILLHHNFSMSRLRHRKVSESCLDTTSVGRVRTHSGCNQTGSPFNMPFSPPMSPYTIQPQVHNVPQDGCSIKTSEGTNVRPEDDKCTRKKQIETSQEHINQPS